MARVTVPLHPRLDIDTSTKTVTFVLSVPAAEGEGDVDVFAQDVTSGLTADQKRRLRHLLDASGEV